MENKTQNRAIVFVPSQKDPNPFLDEIMHYSKNKFIFGGLKSYKKDYPVVLINWPEQLFNWKEPSRDELDELERTFDLWSKTAKIIYVVHDLERHAGMTHNYSRLFNMVLSYANSFIHLGEYSKNLLKKEFPQAHHEVIYHPLYANSFKLYNKEQTRKKLGISKDKLVFIAPGRIRSMTERNFIIDAFNSVKEKNKLLLVPNMFYNELNIEFKGRTKLKKVIDIKKIANKIYNINLNPKHRFNFGFTPFERLSQLMSAADIVIIPRLKILNSGNLFLGLTYRKVIIGPNQGNVLGFLQRLKLPIFNPSNEESIKLAFAKSIILNKAYVYDEKILKDFDPKFIAGKWDTFISKSTL